MPPRVADDLRQRGPMRAREQLPMAITPTLPFGTFTLTVESESGTRASGTFTVVEDAAAALEQRFVLR